MKKIIQISSLAFSLMAVMVFSGCATTQAHIPLSYNAQTGVSKLTEAQTVMANVVVSDQRADKTSVGAKKNGYGMEMASIIATNDVAELVKSAIVTELADRGFNIGTNNAASIIAELNTFRNDFKIGFWSGDAVAQVIINVTVKSQTGEIVYSKLISGQGENPHIQIASGENAEVALDAALKDAMDKMFGDKAFIEALLKPAKPLVTLSSTEAKGLPQ
jgi:uncharacterized lipoprotein